MKCKSLLCLSFIVFHLSFSDAVAQYRSQVWSPDNGDGTYTNPVINADYSDPDVCVGPSGEDYYMTASSFQCVPGLPILHSKDLVNWEIVGHALKELYEGDAKLVEHFSTPQHGAGVWAPSIRYHDGEYYIYWGDPDYGIYMVKTCGGNPAGFVPDKQYSVETPKGKVSLLKGWEHKPGRRMPARESEVFLRWKPVGLYNALEAPLKDFAFSGFIWYQGESNTWNAADYGNLLETLVRTRREELNTPDLPFYIIELAAFEHSELTDTDWGWNRVQKEQRRTAEKVDGVYLVPNADLGEWNDIHPQDKATLGHRTVKAILESRQ